MGLFQPFPFLKRSWRLVEFYSLLGDTKSRKDLHTKKHSLLLSFTTSENGVRARMKTQIKSTRYCNTQEHKH
jgi:hypothetical protein